MHLKVKAPQSFTLALETVWKSRGIFTHSDRQHTVISDGTSDSQLVIWGDGLFGNQSLLMARSTLPLNGWIRLPTDIIKISVQGD